MGQIHIVTDSACDLTTAEVTDLGVRVVPLSIRFGMTEYTDGVDLSVAEFYEQMAANEELPETAAPAPGAFEDTFRAAADAGATGVLCINLSSELSATMQAARTAAKAFDGTLPVEIFDSRSITSGLGTQVRLAAELARDGAELADIVAQLESLRSRTVVYGVLDTLDNLKKGGRIGGAQAMIGSLLQIKPIIDISTGVVHEAGKQRTRKKAFGWLRDAVASAGEVEHLCVYSGKANDVDQLIEMIKTVHDGEIRTGDIGPVIGAHGGPGVIGVTYARSSTSGTTDA
jgi:DegV family protein with EDD domain